MPDYQIRAGVESVVGNYRENNEDRVFVSTDLGLYIVADGMGGQLAGEQASQMAVEIIPEKLNECLQSDSETDSQEDRIAAAIRASVLHSNQEIIALSAIKPDFKNMGTTCVLAVSSRNSIYVAGVGDSRAYLFRDGKCSQLTVDHSLAQALVEAGTISQDDAEKHRFRNILWKYLGSKEVGEGPDVSILDVQPGDRYVLSSDGLTGVLDPPHVLKILLEEDDPQVAAERLVKTALDNDSKDNVSCITLYLDPV